MKRDMGAGLICLYDSYRTALLNRKYYAERLVIYRRWNFALEVIVALGTSSSIAAWTVWKQGIGLRVWLVLAGLVAIIAILKPILQLSKAVERYSKLLVGYTALYNELQGLVLEVKTRKTLTDEMWRCFRGQLSRLSKLDLEDDARPSQRLAHRCYEEVNNEIRPSELWMPETP